MILLDLGLKNKTAIVLASSDGLGKAIAAEFAKEGANVMLFSSTEEKLKAAADEIEILSGRRPWSTTREDLRRAPLTSLRTRSGKAPLS